MTLAIDIGGTHVRLAVGTGTAPWQRSHDVRRPQTMLPAAFVDLIRATLDRWGVTPSAIGIAVAGIVDGGRVLRAENLGWQDVALGALVTDAFGRPTAIETDVFCGARHQAVAGAAKGLPAALYVAVGTGIGHALIIDGAVWRGAQGRANAMGHMVVDPKGAACYCGHRGCLCTIASGRAQGDTDPPRRPLDALAQAIGSALTLIDPRIVVLSGGALQQAWFDLEALERRIADFTYPGIARTPVVVSDVADPNLRGAALLAGEMS